MADIGVEADLRNEDIQSMVTGFALASYKFKNIVMVNSGGAITETYFQETAAELTAQSTASIKGIPRLAKFPNADVSWTKVQGIIDKYGLEGTLSYEDIKYSNIDVLARTLLRIARAVAKAVDDEIYSVLTEGQSPSTINTTASVAAWDAASGQNPVKDILVAMRLIQEDNYDIMTEGGFLAMSPKDFESLFTWTWSQGATAPKVNERITDDGFKRRDFLGLDIIISNSVVADGALVGKPFDCGTWKETDPLQTWIIDEPGVHKIVRSWEMGLTQLTNPEALCYISDTQL